MDLDGKSRRHLVAAFLSARSEAEAKPKEDRPTLGRRISRKAAEPLGADTNKGSPRSETGNAPRAAPTASGREDERRTYSWKNPSELAQDFSSTWTDPEPFVTPERRRVQNCSDVFPECTSNIYENSDPLPPASCTASPAVPVCLVDADNGTPVFEPQPSYACSQPALVGEVSPDTLSSTWVEEENPETGLGARPDPGPTQENGGKTETVISERERKRDSGGDTGLGGSLESSPEAEGEEEHPPIRRQDDFEGDFYVGDSSDDEQLPSLREVYERCQAIRMKRFSGDLYNIWRQRLQAEAKEDALKILTASGFCPADPDEVGEDIDAGLGLVPDRFWRQESKANAISVEELKAVLEERKDAESRRQFREYCASAGSEHRSTRRTAIVDGGGGGSSALLYSYLKMNLISHRVPMYYFPSYLRRYQKAMQLENENDDSESDKESESP